MSLERDKTSLLDIINSMQVAMSYVLGKTKTDFLSDIQCQDAVTRRVEIVGEAANRVSDKTRTRFSDLPWRQMVGMRNILIHQYDKVNLEIMWDTVSQVFPELLIHVEAAFQAMHES